MTEETRYNVSFHNDAEIARKVDQEIPKELLSSRSSGGNNTVTFLKGDISVDRLNEIFGPLGWGCAAGTPEISRFEEPRTKWEKVGGRATPKEVDMVIYAVTTQVKLTIKARSPESTDTVFIQTGVGYGEVEPGKHAKDAIGMAVKGAETDGLKRCTSLLGKAFGMFLTAEGAQSDIEYAHRGQKDNLTKAKGIRSRSGGNQAASQDRQQTNRDTARPAQRPEARPNNNQNAANQGNAKQQGNGGQQQGNDKAEEKRPAASSPSKREDNASKPAEGNAKPRPKSDVNDNFDLDSEPVTRSDQVSFGATIIRKLGEIQDHKDREALIRKYRDTISNLEGNVLTRLKEATKRHDIDIDKIKG